MAATRSSSNVYLIGHSSPTFPPGVLPANLDILREVKWKKETLGESIPLNKVISCPMGREFVGALCSSELGCLKLEEEKQCTLQKVKRCWSQAGIKTILDKHIVTNISKLWAEYKELVRRRNRMTTTAVQARERFKDILKKCFNVSSKDALETIQNDKKRDEKAKQSDIMFLADQLGERKMIFTTLDKKYEKVMQRVEQRSKDSDLRKQKEEMRVSASNTTVHFDDEWEDECEENQDEGSDNDSPVKKKPRIIPIGGKRMRARKVRGRTIKLDVPVDILQLTVADAIRLQLTPSQHQGIIASFINVSGGSLDEFPISDSSSRRDRKIALRSKKEEIISKFTESVRSGDKRLVGHFDGKLMKELEDNKDMKVDRVKEDRMAVLVTSPDLEDKEQLLGILALKDGTGKSQQQGVMELMVEWGAWNHLVGLVYDTTASNTGIWRGAVTLI